MTHCFPSLAYNKSYSLAQSLSKRTGAARESSGIEKEQNTNLRPHVSCLKPKGDVDVENFLMALIRKIRERIALMKIKFCSAIKLLPI